MWVAGRAVEERGKCMTRVGKGKSVVIGSPFVEHDIFGGFGKEGG